MQVGHGSYRGHQLYQFIFCTSSRIPSSIFSLGPVFCQTSLSSITHCQCSGVRSVQSFPMSQPQAWGLWSRLGLWSRCEPVIQAWPTVYFILLTLCYTGYINSGRMAEAMQIWDIPKLGSIIEEHTFSFCWAHWEAKPGDREIVFQMICLRENLVSRNLGLEREKMSVSEWQHWMPGSICTWSCRVNPLPTGHFYFMSQ